MRPVTPWQRRRSAFSHDWLKNHYLQALGAFQNVLNGQIEDPEFEREFVARILPEWEAGRAEIIALAGTFEEEMSPRTLFARPPLSTCDAETRRWLGELAHGLWLARRPVRAWASAAVALVQEADGWYAAVRVVVARSGEAGSARSAFADFRRACLDLAQAVEQFPSEVEVT